MFELIAFDADDTLWHNETMFQATTRDFAALLSEHHPPQSIQERLFATEVRNLGRFGYGIKGFVLSMIETAIELTEGRVTGPQVKTILDWGHAMLQAPVSLLDGVRETIAFLAQDHRLMLLTKGDLFDQESKLARSGLGEYFSAVEIVSEKSARTYSLIMARHGVAPPRFLMVGNSLRSDVLPVLEAGGAAVHIPYVETWAHEHVAEDQVSGKTFARLENIRALHPWLAGGGAPE
ncbi:MAG TPA: HAD family hydrolase [Vicinamibacteria bacterium]|nr:HAD family hydrolase [Vicinamibacteria bacterium]